MSPLLAHPEQAGLNALRPGSLYCYGMILYMDAQYTAKFRKLAGEKLPHDQFKKQSRHSILNFPIAQDPYDQRWTL